jgi:hypothetical protein
MSIFPNQFSIEYDAADHLLTGSWLCNIADNDLYPCYEHLLTAAKAHGNCRFWLLDMRLRGWHSPTFAKWFGDLLAKQVVRELGPPVFVAYVAHEKHRTDIEGDNTQATLKQSAQVEFYPYFFDNKEEARDWLLYYQAHPDQKPAVSASSLTLSPPSVQPGRSS